MNSNPSDNSIVLEWHILIKHGEIVTIWNKTSSVLSAEHFLSFPTGIIQFNLISLQEQLSHELDAILSSSIASFHWCSMFLHLICVWRPFSNPTPPIQEQFSEVLDAMFELRVQPQEHVIDQGDDGDNFYVIER